MFFGQKCLIWFSLIFYSVTEKPWEGHYEQKIIILHILFIFHYLQPNVHPSSRAVQGGSLRTFAFWFCWFHSPPLPLPGAWMSVSCECCVLSGRGLCDGPIPLPEESYRLWCVWVWSWRLDNEALDPWDCCDMIKKDTPMVSQTHNIYPSARSST